MKVSVSSKGRMIGAGITLCIILTAWLRCMDVSVASYEQFSDLEVEREIMKEMPFAVSEIQHTIPVIDYDNMDHDKILVLTPVKNAAKFIDSYFDMLRQTTYPKHLIHLAFLVTDSTDGTLERLEEHAAKNYGFADMTIIRKDYNFKLERNLRSLYDKQRLRRGIIARSRNVLLSTAMRPDIGWVAWIDVDVIKYPKTIFEDFISVGGDIVVPNCMQDLGNGHMWGFDRNNWQETEHSIEFQKDLDEKVLVVEGYPEIQPGRHLLVDMPRDDEVLKTVPLDGVGGTFTFVRAQVHREGANFPAFLYRRHIETEGFAKIAKEMDFTIYGLPSYIIYHTSDPK